MKPRSYEKEGPTPLSARLSMLADKHERIEGSDDAWKNPPFLVRDDRMMLREASLRMVQLRDIVDRLEDALRSATLNGRSQHDHDLMAAARALIEPPVLQKAGE